MNLNRGVAVFEFVFLADGGERQFALFAYRHEALVQLMGDDGAEDEAARIDAGDDVDAVFHVAQDKGVDEDAEGARILQQRRDVAELDAGLRASRERCGCGL